MLTGGDTGPALVPRDVDRSLLIQAIRHTHDGLSMPPNEKLSDAHRDILVNWVNNGAEWPSEVLVVFDEEESIVESLVQGEAQIRIERQEAHSGKLAVAVTPHERCASQIANWSFPVRENPVDGEYRYLRFAWKKIGPGAAMLEIADRQQWPLAKASPPPAGRYAAGVNDSELDAILVNPNAPSEWEVVTIDLWKDMGDIEVTGLSLMCIGGGETQFDKILLARDVNSLDAYEVGGGRRLFRSNSGELLGDAWSDPKNPVIKAFAGERLDLWSLKRPQRPDLPTVKQGEWCRNPVDHFVLGKLEAAGITPSAEADRRVLIRRLYFDLLGLPPTPEEVQAFVKDTSATAYEELIEQLLANPHYGERWGRHWLDVVRYADTNGCERDEFRPTAFHFRDYVIRSLNADKPYDAFIREQLAGDEMVPNAPETSAEADRLIGTGFLRAGQFDSTAPIFQEEARARDQLMADLANTTCSAFLGLTISCANCHDHKYDPLLQADHFRIRAFFSAVKNDDAAVDLASDQQRISEHNAAIDVQVAELKAQLEATPEDQAEKRQSLNEQISKIEAGKQGLTTTLVMRDDGPNAPPTHIFYQGDHTSPRDEVQPGFLSILDPNPAEITRPHENTTGRRTALANWIASAENPLTARVMVNRIWQYHFGEPLVATPNDFGLQRCSTDPSGIARLACLRVQREWLVD